MLTRANTGAKRIGGLPPRGWSIGRNGSEIRASEQVLRMSPEGRHEVDLTASSGKSGYHENGLRPEGSAGRFPADPSGLGFGWESLSAPT